MKEYQFEPASQMIHVSEGDTVELKVIGRRVEFRYWLKQLYQFIVCLFVHK